MARGRITSWLFCFRENSSLKLQSILKYIDTPIEWVGKFAYSLILAPIYIPIVTALDLNMVWFGVLFGVALASSHLTPPFAYSVFFLKSVAEGVTTAYLYRGALPFVLIFIVALVIVYAFPQLSLWLPNLLGMQ